MRGEALDQQNVELFKKSVLIKVSNHLQPEFKNCSSVSQKPIFITIAH